MISPKIRHNAIDRIKIAPVENVANVSQISIVIFLFHLSLKAPAKMLIRIYAHTKQKKLHLMQNIAHFSNHRKIFTFRTFKHRLIKFIIRNNFHTVFCPL